MMIQTEEEPIKVTITYPSPIAGANKEIDASNIKVKFDDMEVSLSELLTHVFAHAWPMTEKDVHSSYEDDVGDVAEGQQDLFYNESFGRCIE